MNVEEKTTAPATEEKKEVASFDTATRGHHPDSPSSLQASEACPLFENEQRVSLAGEKGTLQHKAAETRDLELLDGDEAMIGAVQKCLDYEDSVFSFFRNTLKVEPLSDAEQYLPVGDDRVRDEKGTEWIGVTGGFPDKTIYSLTAGVAHVLDWKFGAIPVTPTKDNLQGMAYALGVFQKLGLRMKSVTVHFFAPYQNWTEQEQNEKYIHEFTRADIPRMELRIRTVIARKKSPNAKPVAKEDLCIWCKRKGDCPAAWSAVVPIGGKYEDLEAPEVVPPHKLSLPSEFAKALRFAGQVEAWAKAVKARCSDVVKTEGIDVPGYTLVSRSDRKVESVALFKQAAVKNGLTEEEFLNTLTVTFDPVTKLIKAKAAKGKGAAAIRQFDSDLEELGAVSKGKPYFFLQQERKKTEEIINV